MKKEFLLFCTIACLGSFAAARKAPFNVNQDIATDDEIARAFGIDVAHARKTSRRTTQKRGYEKGRRAEEAPSSKKGEKTKHVKTGDKHGNKGAKHGNKGKDEGDEEPSFDDDSQFYQAESLEYIRDGIDPDFFEWINKDEVQPGGTTCGFMYPRLGSQPLEEYPTIEVYVCMRFANIQPAAKGNIVTHCGGPGSLSGCAVFGFEGELQEDNLDNYNIISFDQRGLGRSSPSFAHDECTLRIEFMYEGETVTASPLDFVDVTNEQSVRDYLDLRRDRVLSCWGCTDCGFQLTTEGTDKTFHFLEFSGSRQLAEDMERMRILLNAPTLHLYGISYGTTVMATYATIAPAHVGLFVLDGSVHPGSDIQVLATDAAIGSDYRLDYVLYSCEIRNAVNPGSCPVSNLRECLDAMSDLQFPSSPELQEFASSLDFIGNMLGTLFQFPDRATDLCDAAKAMDADAFGLILFELYAESFEGRRERSLQAIDSQPTSPSFVQGNPNYAEQMSGDIAQSMVMSQDYAGANYDQNFFIGELQEIAKKYDGAGSFGPVYSFLFWYGTSYYWPRATPLPPRGNPLITGIISGQAFDYATPYKWTLDMRSQFKFATLLTSRSVNHGLGSAETLDRDADCQRYITNYFTTGFVDIVDGTTCGAPFASEAELLGAFGANIE